MANLNIGEYGQTIRANLGEDISTATSYTIVLEPRYGDKLEKTGTLGTANVTVGDEIYLENEYIEYVIQPEDLTYAGLWRKKGEAILSSTNKVVSDYELITVLE